MHIRKVTEHNLKGFDLELAHDQIIVVTGVSGSGKSSLVQDCIHREGQRRYLESFSTHARQFLARLPRPKVEGITGLRATAAVSQHGSGARPRSTVGTLSGLWDYLRLLWARVGLARCPSCGSSVEGRSPSLLASDLRQRFGGSSLSLFAVLVDGHRGSRGSEIARAAEAGIERFRLDGLELSLEELRRLDPGQRHSLDALVGRFDPLRCAELPALLERAFDLGRGVLRVVAPGEELRWARDRACGTCAASIPELGPRLFSFNGRWGACPACNGLGVEDRVDPERLVADPSRSLREGALLPTTPNGYIVYSQVTVDVMDEICRAHGFSVDRSWSSLSDEQRNVIFYGSDRLTVPFGKHPLENRLKWSGITARPREEGHYKGLIPTIEGILARDRNKNALRFARTMPCHACEGLRLGPDARSVTVDGMDIATISTWSFHRLLPWLRGLKLETEFRRVLVEPLARRLDLLVRLGVGHLSCHRGADGLSGGEMQRLRLASGVAAEVSGLCYVLDEPSVGVHPAEIPAMVEVFRNLRDRGNTVLVSEHDPMVWAAADHLVELGPSAARTGGHLLLSSSRSSLSSSSSPPPPGSRVARILASHAPSPGTERSSRRSSGELVVRAPRHNNLKGETVRFQLGVLNGVTGPSGAGKSSLVEGILARHLRQRFHGARERPGAHEGIEGLEAIETLIDVDQKPIGRSPRSNAATYTKLFDVIRDLYARSPDAKALGLKKSDFSFNTKGGRCESCEGAGVETVGLHFLADATRPCESCGGKRFNDTVLTVRHEGLTVAELLDCTVDEAMATLGTEKKARPILEALRSVGLGYLHLGQAATTLSGGEAQRVKLGTHLARPSRGHCLYLLDEPTAGLHPDDVQVLLTALEGLLDRGHTVIVVEHDLDVVRSCDWIVDLGPTGGDEGGFVCAQGGVAEIMAAAGSPTGRVLRGEGEEKEKEKRKASAGGGWIGGVGGRGLSVQGLTIHNLRQVDFCIPRERLTVITGPSGSGKSSLAFDGLAAEAQARVFEGMSGQARRFLANMERPELDEARGLGPTVALGQRVPGRNPRSTVGTFSELDEYLRLLFSRYGEAEGEERPLRVGELSFNRVEGACGVCGGLGHRLRCDPDILVTNPERSLLDGALDGTKTGRFYGERDGRHLAELRAAAAVEGFDFEAPWQELDEAHRRFAMEGAGERVYTVRWEYRRGKREGRHDFEACWKGFARLVEEEWERKHGDRRAEALEGLMHEHPCPDCHGERLGSKGRRLRWAGHRLPELWALSLDECLALLRQEGLAGDEELLEELRRRLAPLIEGGLGHLSLGRTVESLSGGELQRLRLAAQLGARLTGLTYVLDEPTRGLHVQDTKRLLELLFRLRDGGNTVVVVEHDPEFIRAADHVIDLGPGAGAEGGRIVAEGSPDELASNENSVTGPYLIRQGPMLPPSRLRAATGQLRLEGIERHNLRKLDLSIPTGGMVVVTGPSGAGKSTLVFDVLAASLISGRPRHCSAVEGGQAYDEIVRVDGRRLAPSPASTPLTVTGLMDELRKAWAAGDEAKAAGFKKGDFSYRSKGGACPACKGLGRLRLDMDFLGSIWVPCEDCGGLRFGETVGRIRWKGRSLSELMAMTVVEAASLPLESRAWLRGLDLLRRVGLGHLRLGQGADTLSGGEAQRLTLAADLMAARKGTRRLYLFDEPTIGLHRRDVEDLVRLFDALVDEGHDLVVVEHDLDLAQHGDWILDLGPEGGPGGGRLMALARPHELASCNGSATGRALTRLFSSASS